MQIFYNQKLKNYNTFNIEASCLSLTIIEDENELMTLSSEKFFDTPFLLMGGGSNLLFTQNYDGNIIHLNTKGIEVIREDNSFVWLKVAAGENWEDLINYCINNQLFGLENLSGIPGCVGSSPVQNIGAYGVEVKDSIHEVHYFDISHAKFQIISNAECHFKYRNSIFKQELKNKVIITQVIFRLSKNANFQLGYGSIQEELAIQNLPLNLYNINQTIINIRNKKLPDIKKIGCAGSFFKNPIISNKEWEILHLQYPDLISFSTKTNQLKLAAGQLIEKAGWKGFREGDAGVYPLQALILVNYGNASGNEILNLSYKIQNSVYQMFNVKIEAEVNII